MPINENEIHTESISKLFYSKEPLMSYNAMLNMILGGRGTGKTFTFKKYALSDESSTIWVRRYKDDLKDVEKSFMRDLYANGLFLEDDIKVVDDILFINGVAKIYFIGLSISHKKKSVAYPDANKIIFDEFIEVRKNKKYLPDEVTLFLELWNTVNRLRLDRPEARCYLIANKVSFINPYFAYWNITPFEGRFKRFKKGLIVVENYTNLDFEEAMSKTRFGQLVEGTRYGDYAIHNKNFNDTNVLIEPRPPKSRLICNIRYNTIKFGLWFDDESGLFFCSKDINPEALSYGDRFGLQSGELPMMNNQPPISWLYDAMNRGLLRFSDSATKGACFSLMQESYK